ncbi:tetratricopeptide repeat protein [Sphingobacterium griseoflavum]|uniref:Tetratricopeptide repeat protein n=1 Tax=Sphingobacterium griseoflavum TaxID=1474952 RepID=A0ABQ3HU36_9SPHI|nr:tetratricopeptide repeat protein [Sphingobacterium griseoflavum]GHE34727.1 hypothetical protein GCM10017764_17360 [Sphingobacterium griseoflavum]
MQLNNNRYFALASAQLLPFSSFLSPVHHIADEAVLFAKQALEKVESKAWKDALSMYTQGIETYPEQAFFHACRSLLNAHLGDQEGAFYDYQVAKSIDFNYHIYLEWFENKPDTATIDPAVGYSDLQALLEAALDATQGFDYEHAVVLYSKALVTFENSAEILVYRGALYMRLLRYDLAIADFESALTLDPTHFPAKLAIAKFYEAVHEEKAARDTFDEAALLSPESSLVYEERGNFFVEQHAYPEALADYNMLVSLLPDDFYVYAIRADLLGKMEKWDEALQDYSRAIQLNPYYSDLYSYRAEAKEKLGDAEGAAADRRLYEQIEAED